MKTIAILAAAGSGVRLGAGRAKLWAAAAGRPLVYHSLTCLHKAERIDGVIVMTPPDDVDELRDSISEWGFSRVIDVLPGGRFRQETVRMALGAIPPSYEIVVVHDCARPLASPELFERVIEAARKHGAATAATEPVDTIVRYGGGNSIEYLDRGELRLIQTPQAFKTDIIRQAHKKAAEDGVEGTDDAGLVLRMGVRVEIVEGEALNFKVTHSQDLELLENLLESEVSSD